MTAGHPAKGLAHKGCALALEAIHLPPQTLLLCNVPRRPSAPIDVTGIELMSAARTTEAGVVRIEAPCTRTRKEGQELHRKVPTHNQSRDEHCQPEGLCMYMCAWVCTPVCVPLRIHCTCAYILASMCVQAAEFSCTDLYQGHKSLMPTRRGQFHPSGALVCVAWHQQTPGRSCGKEGPCPRLVGLQEWVWAENCSCGDTIQEQGPYTKSTSQHWTSGSSTEDVAEQGQPRRSHTAADPSLAL
jgi:hypothetical protein